MRALEINEKGEFREVKTEKNEKRLTITLKEETYNNAKIEAIRLGMPVKQLIEDVLSEYLKDKFVPSELERYYDTRDLALFLGITKEGLTEHYRKGNIKGIKFRNEWYSTTDQVKEFLDYRNKENKK